MKESREPFSPLQRAEALISQVGSLLISETSLRTFFETIVRSFKRVRCMEAYIQEGALILLLTIADIVWGRQAGIRLFFVIPIFRLTRRTGLLPGIIAALGTGLICAEVDYRFGDKTSLIFGLLLNPMALFLIAIMANSFNDRLSEERWQAETDTLTGTLNRRGFDRALKQAMEDRHQTQERISIAVIDLDSFKTLNDIHGHAFGDTVLKAVKTCISPAIAEGGFLARIGGDEFAAVFQGIDPEDARLRLQRARIRFKKITQALGDQSSFSYGLAEIPNSKCSVEDIFNAADRDMYQCKASSKTGVVNWQPSEAQTPWLA